jgi:hypothetical protein
MWLRRLIDDIFLKNYGENYFNHTLSNGSNLFSAKIKKEINDRILTDSKRFTRPIDACLLETEIKIITNPKFYKDFFNEVFSISFTKGNSEMLRILMTSLVNPRNKLYHANPISVREAEKIVCYSNDIIDCIKEYYKKNKMSEEFNVPLILKYKDSFVNTIYIKNFGSTLVGVNHIDLSKKSDFILRPSNKISIEVEIDSSFEKDFYDLTWSPKTEIEQTENHYSYQIQNKDIGEDFTISLKLVTKNEWHRKMGWDDYLVIRFKVLPPI